MKKAIILFWGSLLFAIFLTGPFLALAKIGVGVGIGKIQVDQPLKSGLIYTLPNFVLVNTGNEPSEYGIQIAYHQDQPELRPAKEWFKFEPSQFYLEPDQSQSVQIKLTLPIRGAKPGDYFAFLQGRPLQKTENGMTSVGMRRSARRIFFATTISSSSTTVSRITANEACWLETCTPTRMGRRFPDAVMASA